MISRQVIKTGGSHTVYVHQIWAKLAFKVDDLLSCVDKLVYVAGRYGIVKTQAMNGDIPVSRSIGQLWRGFRRDDEELMAARPQIRH